MTRHDVETPGAVPARVVVDLGAITDNVSALRRHVRGTPVMAVVKGDAYGHGLLPVARAALAGGACWLGTAQLSEALALRAAGVDAPVLSWLHAPGAPFAQALAVGIDLGVSAPWALAEIEGAAAGGEPARIHLKIDTGLGRNGAFGPADQGSGKLGADARELIEAAAAAQRRGRVRVVGLMSHFAESDVPGSPSIRAQHEVFARALEHAMTTGLHIELAHLANSAATLLDVDARYDLVRPGLAIYGLSPAPQAGAPADFGLRPAMRVAADVSLVKAVPAGCGVSYGHTYTTLRATRLALLPVGYADGIPRHASGAGPVRLGGARHTIAGRVCMDQIVLDVGTTPVAPGDEAVLFSDGLDGSPTAQEWADAAGTISYEIVTRIGGRLPRVYVGQRPGSSPGEAAGEPGR